MGVMAKYESVEQYINAKQGLVNLDMYVYTRRVRVSKYITTDAAKRAIE